MKSLKIICAVALILTISGAAQASPTEVTYEDGKQDPLWVPLWVDELGNPPVFPSDEEITSYDTFAEHIPCPIDFDPGGPPNVRVGITNQTGKSWTDLWYVADPETFLTNDDGWINGQLAFKIDAVGVNTPLVWESVAFDGIFTPGETWEFVIQNYANQFGLAPSLFGTIGVPSVGDLTSTGSVIAIPAPGAILLGSLGVSLVGWLRRRKTL